MAEPVQKRSKADEQRFLLDKASNNVKREAFFMKSAFDKDDLKDALKHASDMLNELRTGMLSPKKLLRSLHEGMR